MNISLTALRSAILDRDFLVRRYIPIAMLASLILCAVAIEVGVEYCSALGILSAPFVAVGVLFLFLDRHWILLVASVALSLISYLVSPWAALIMICMTLGSEGVATLAAAVQHRSFFKPLDKIVSQSDDSTYVPKVIRSVFGIPEGIDSRGIRSDGGIIRHDIPWNDMMWTAMLALPLSMILWTAVLVSPKIGGSDLVHLSALMSVVLYIMFLALIPCVYRSLNVRVESMSGRLDLYRGLAGTSVKTSVVLLVIFLFTLFASDYGTGEFLNIVVCALLTVVMAVLASVAYYFHQESSVVGRVMEEWDSQRSVDLYCRLEESRPPALDDGVPGTPARRDR